MQSPPPLRARTLLAGPTRRQRAVQLRTPGWRRSAACRAPARSPSSSSRRPHRGTCDQRSLLPATRRVARTRLCQHRPRGSRPRSGTPAVPPREPHRCLKCFRGSTSDRARSVQGRRRHRPAEREPSGSAGHGSPILTGCRRSNAISNAVGSGSRIQPGHGGCRAHRQSALPPLRSSAGAITGGTTYLDQDFREFIALSACTELGARHRPWSVLLELNPVATFDLCAAVALPRKRWRRSGQPSDAATRVSRTCRT